MKITFYTGVMNRLQHLSEVLPKSLDVCSEFDNIKFVLLDYGSNDGIEDWVVDNLQWVIESEFLDFYQNVEKPEYYFRCHAKNIAAKLTHEDSDYIVNLDADNWITSEYIQMIMELWNYNENFVVHGNQSAWGRIGIKRETFMTIGGYNEDLKYGWGYEDMDLIQRAKLAGCTDKMIKDKLELKRFLNHPSDLRYSHSLIKDNKETCETHKNISIETIAKYGYLANTDRLWGSATLIKNCCDRISI